MEYLCFTGDITRTKSEIDGHKPVSFSVSAAQRLYLDNEFDWELAPNETLVLSVPSGLGPNEFADRIINRYGSTGQLQVEEYKIPFDPLSPPRINLYLKIRNPYIYHFNKSIQENRNISLKLLKEVDHQSPFSFEEQHFETIVDAIIKILRELIIYLHIHSRTQNQKSSLRQYIAVVETHFYYSFSRLELLVMQPLKMSKETLHLVGECLDYAYSAALREEKCHFLDAPADDSQRILNTLRELDVYNRQDYIEKIGYIIKILDNFSPLQYNELYDKLNAEIGNTISKSTFERCLNFLISSGQITHRPISGCGRGKHVQISKSVASTNFGYSSIFSWRTEKIMTALTSEPPSVIELHHWKVIWTQISSILRVLVSELYAYSNWRNKQAGANRYDKFLKTQLIPSLTGLSKLVSPLEMSNYTKETLLELTSITEYTLTGAVNHPLNNLTPTEGIQILNRLNAMKLSSMPEGKYSTLSPESIKYIESRKICDVLLNEIRKNRSTTNHKNRVGKKRGRPKKPLSDEEKSLIDHVYSERPAGACTLEKIIEKQYNQKISHNKIHTYLASINESYNT